MVIKDRFPLFITSKDKDVLVVGGGKIATRRIETLLNFDFKVRCVAPSFSEKINKLGAMDKLTLVRGDYNISQVENAFIVLACTDDREVNHRVYTDCKDLQVLVNCCDVKEECDFFFPAIAINEDVTVGIVGDGKSHGKTREVASAVRDLIERKAY